MTLRCLALFMLAVTGLVEASPVATDDTIAVEGSQKRDPSDKSGNVHFHLGCHGGLYPVNEGIDQTFHYHGITVSDPDGERSANCTKNRDTRPAELDCVVTSPYLAARVHFALHYEDFNCDIINMKYCGKTYGSDMDIPECGNSAHVVPGTSNAYADCYIHGCSSICTEADDINCSAEAQGFPPPDA